MAVSAEVIEHEHEREQGVPESTLEEIKRNLSKEHIKDEVKAGVRRMPKIPPSVFFGVAMITTIGLAIGGPVNGKSFGAIVRSMSITWITLTVLSLLVYFAKDMVVE